MAFSDHNQEAEWPAVRVQFVAVQEFIGDDTQTHLTLQNPDHFQGREDVVEEFWIDGIVNCIVHL